LSVPLFIYILLFLFSYPPSVTSVISKQWEWCLEGIMSFRKWYPLKQVLLDDDSCQILESVILHTSHWNWFTNSVIFICFLFPRFVYIYIFFHLHIYLQHRNYRRNTSVGILLNSPVLLFFFIQKFTKFGNSVAFFMPSFSPLIRVQSNPGIRRTPRLQKMAYHNLITVSDRLHTRRSRVGVSKLQRTNEKQ